MDWLNTLFTLLMLVLLQAVLGFDNLLYISLESKRAPEGQRARVRKIGIGLAVVLRIVLLFALTKLISLFVEPFLTIPAGGPLSGTFNVESVIVLAGGVFIIYTATKEIFHMLGTPELEGATEKKPKSAGGVIFWIVLMNLVFSFDSILSAMALTDSFWLMATAIVIGGILMIVLANTISNFLEKNRLYEVLGLFILFIVGIMLLSEGAHKAQIHLFGYEVTAMSKATFYFVLAVLVLIDVVQSRFQKKLLAKAAAAARARDRAHL